MRGEQRVVHVGSRQIEQKKHILALVKSVVRECDVNIIFNHHLIKVKGIPFSGGEPDDVVASVSSTEVMEKL